MIDQVTVKSSPLLRLTADGKFLIAKTETEVFINAALVTVCELPPVYEKVCAMSNLALPVPVDATASVTVFEVDFAKVPVS